MFRINKIVFSIFLFSNVFIGAGQAFGETSITSGCIDISQSIYLGFSDVGRDGVIFKLQKFLVENRLLNTEPTGYFGSLTKEAVKKFQSNRDIEPTGVAGPLTRAELKKITCDPSTLTIATISPIADVVGTKIKIVGNGFGDNNTVLIGAGALSNIPSSKNGTVIEFTLPEYITPYCSTGSVCPAMSKKIEPNTIYQFSVISLNRQSNKVLFYATSKDAVVKINSLKKTSGAIGSVVTLYGTGFTDENDILFGEGAIIDIFSSGNGTELSFKIPSKMYRECYYYPNACPAESLATGLGDYIIQVKNVYGVSNSKTFTVTNLK